MAFSSLILAKLDAASLLWGYRDGGRIYIKQRKRKREGWRTEEWRDREQLGMYLRQVRKEDLTGASPQNVPVTPRHKLLTFFFKHL